MNWLEPMTALYAAAIAVPLLVLLVAAVIYLMWWCKKTAAKVVSQHARIIFELHKDGPAIEWPPDGLNFP